MPGTLDRTPRQWVDLGIHTEACMTRPETCGGAGGAISLWVNVIHCPGMCGIVSSHQVGKTGSIIHCLGSNFGYDTYMYLPI